MPVY
jgi:dTDP-4-amino-4,6-dideoxy-D-glucose acyltransferase